MTASSHSSYRKRRFAARAGKIDGDGYEDQTLAYFGAGSRRISCATRTPSSSRARACRST
jgi:hypothetical protein